MMIGIAAHPTPDINGKIGAMELASASSGKRTAIRTMMMIFKDLPYTNVERV